MFVSETHTVNSERKQQVRVVLDMDTERTAARVTSFELNTAERTTGKQTIDEIVVTYDQRHTRPTRITLMNRDTRD
jgi:hypothetical protein